VLLPFWLPGICPGTILHLLPRLQLSVGAPGSSCGGHRRLLHCSCRLLLPLQAESQWKQAQPGGLSLGLHCCQVLLSIAVLRLQL
jgi:hypothetical protein